ncbi:MAG: cysteine desulfurase NifS [Chloroflexi bacterium]|nr:cysteine desulfurase NifS [Chloroflexota bacterium]
MVNRMIYLDHAATTPVDPRVVEAMLPYFSQHYGNPSSLYRWGQEGRRAIDQARSRIAKILNCSHSEIIFTSGGTESDNLAIRGVAFARHHQGNHIITSRIEHHAVERTCQQREREFGSQVTYLPVDRYGRIDPADVERAITPQTTLISIMYANNEMGTIQPIAEIGEIARHHSVAFHTDAVQAAGYLDLDVEVLKVDLLSLSGHKFYGPKGVGVLYLRRGLKLLPTQTGGSHEDNRRAGTENVPGIVGLALALELAQQDRQEKARRLITLRDRLIQGILERVSKAQLTGHPTQRMPNSASFAIDGASGESLLMALDLAGICASSGSACTSGSLEPSYVLKACGLPDRLAVGALRLTLGHENTEEEIEYTLETLPAIVERLRAVAPAYA